MLGYYTLTWHYFAIDASTSTLLVKKKNYLARTRSSFKSNQVSIGIAITAKSQLENKLANARIFEQNYDIIQDFSAGSLYSTIKSWIHNLPFFKSLLSFLQITISTRLCIVS